MKAMQVCRDWASLLITLVALNLSSLCARAEVQPKTQLDAVKSAISSDRLSMQLRAVQRLGLTAVTNAAWRDSLVDLLWEQKSSLVNSEAVFWLTRLGTIGLREVERRMIMDGKLNEPILESVSQLGKTDERTIAFLNAKLEQADSARLFGPELEVCIANLGDRVAEHEKSLIQSLRSGSPQTEKTLTFLEYAPPKWGVSKQFTDVLVANLATNNYRAAMSAMILVQLGGFEGSIAETVEGLYNQSKSDDSKPAYRLLYAMILAKGIEQHRGKYLSAAAEFFGSEDSFSHTVQAAAYHVIHRLMDDETINRFIKMSEEENDSAARGAIRWTGMLGLRAADAVPPLIRIVRSKRNDVIREAAAVALGAVAPANRSNEIRELLSQEKSRSVRDALSESLSLMLLEP